MCRHMCPVGHVSHLESLTPHGWGQVVASEKRGLLTWNESTIDVMYSCADCGVCQSHCVTDQPLPDAIAAVRARLANAGLAPEVVMSLKDQFEAWENPYVEQAPEKSSGTGEYALFVGDATHLWAETLPAVLKLLKAIDIEPVLIGKGRNSGFLASSLGMVGMARQLAGKNMKELSASSATQLLVLTPGDHYTFNTLYPERLGITLPGEVHLYDAVSLLDDRHRAGVIGFNRIEMGLPYAYVDPSHAVRVLNRVAAPRRLLNSVLPTPVIELFWRKERAHPVGDGALHFTHPALARKLTEARNADAMNAGAQGIVTEDPAALYHLSKLSSSGLPVKGMYELLADRIA